MPLRIRIYQGETIAGLAWANATLLIGGDFSVVYDDGKEDIFSLNMTTTTSNRLRTAMNTKRVAKADGYIVSGSVWQLAGSSNTTAAQRGACYVLLGVSDKETQGGSAVTFPTRLRTLCCGYLYLGHPLSVGEFVESGPSGGSGQIKEISVTATAVNGSGGLVLAVAPSNAMWRWVGGIIKYVASGTVGSRAISVRHRDGGANEYMRAGPRVAATAGQTVEVVFSPNLTTEGNVNIFANSATAEGPSPDRAISPSYDLFIEDESNIDVADTASMEASVEEWVIPGV